MKKIILDTDLGSDCDDAGALAVLHHMADIKKAEILAVTHCASEFSGAVTVKMINEFYGRKDITVGIFDKKEFLTDERCTKFTRPLMTEYLKTREIPEFENATRVMRRVLEHSRNVTIIVIGMLNNIVELLKSKADNISRLDGMELVKQSVDEIYIMGGDFKDLNHGEWNIVNDIDGAVFVSENCPVPLIYCGFELGENVMTGKNLENASEDHPVRFTYRVMADRAKKKSILRNSWDPITVYCAVENQSLLFKKSDKCGIGFDSEGRVKLSSGEKDCYLTANASDEKIAEVIDALLY